MSRFSTKCKGRNSICLKKLQKVSWEIKKETLTEELIKMVPKNVFEKKPNLECIGTRYVR